MVADRARCKPWELDDAPSWWVERVRVALIAENAARDEARRHEDRRAKQRRAMGRG